LASNTAERFSIAYFLNPGAESIIAPLMQPGFEEQAHYDPIHWAEFRSLRGLGDYGNHGEEVQIIHYQR
jgi:isopenicillin N synthase-like dioxygenase